MQNHWIADRCDQIEVSGIRKVFDLAKSLKDPINLSIGIPDFDVPEPIKAAGRAALDRGENRYTVSQGIAPLRERLLADVRKQYQHADRDLLVTSGTSGGLVLALQCCLNPGDEVICFDPYFVGYPHFITLAGGKMVVVDTAPDFRIDVDRVAAAITPRTKVILVNSPVNPTGVVVPRETLRGLAQLARDRRLLLLSDEVYRHFCYDESFTSPAEFNEDTVVVDGFSKTYAMTGWRLGFCYGPKQLIDEMIKFQQCTFVCAPSVGQHMALAALDHDVSPIIAAYRQKRDRIYHGLKDRFDIVKPEGAFYMYPRAPWGTGAAFVADAVRHNLLIIPGNVFSRHDTHFRISYAAADAVLDKGIEVLNGMARRGS